MTLIPLAICAFIVNLGYGVVIPVLPTLVATSITGVGFFYGIFSATKIFSQLVGGVLADQRGAARVLALAVLLYAISLAGLAGATSAEAVMAWRALEGVAVGLSYPCVSAVVLSASSKESFAKNHGAILGFGGAGMVVGPVVATLIGRELLRPLLFGIAGAALLSVLPLFFFGPRSTKNVQTFRAATSTLFGLLSSPAFLLLVLPLGFGKLAFSIMQPLIPVRGAALGLDPRVVGITFGLNGVLFAVMQPISGRLVDRFGAPRTALLGMLIAVTAVFAQSLDRGPFFAAMTVTYASAGGLIFGANTALLGQRYHDDRGDYAKVFAAMHMATDLGMIVAPILFMGSYERAPTAAFAVLSGLGLVMAALFARSATGNR